MSNREKLDDEGNNNSVVSPAACKDSEKTKCEKVEKNFGDEKSTRTSAVTLLISLALTKKSSPKRLSSWIDLSLKLDGRDQITKALQYSSRLIAFIFEYLGIFSLSKRFRSLQGSLGSSRKAYRLGKSLVLFSRILNIWKLLLSGNSVANKNSKAGQINDKDEKAHYISSYSALRRSIFTSLQLLGLAGYFFGDNLIFLAHSSFLLHDKQEKIFWKKFTNRCYFFASIMSFYNNGNELFQQNNTKEINAEQRSVHGKEMQVLIEKQIRLFIATVKSSCDILDFSNNIGINLYQKIFDAKLNEGAQSIFGLLSALASIYNNFPKAKDVKT